MAMLSTKGIKEYKDNLKGKVWVFPDNVDTDAISPGQYLNDVEATLNHTCETVIKEFPSQAKDGDIILAGRNFGCGSSRETAPIILQEKGIAAIVAESFARIFYRSSFARALPIIEVKGISKKFETGDEIEINIPNAEVTNLKTGKKLIMATPRIKQGFLLLNPQKISEKYYNKASTIRGAYRYGINLSPWDLPLLDLKVTGSVAVTKQGIRLGKGEGYSKRKDSPLFP